MVKKYNPILFESLGMNNNFVTTPSTGCSGKIVFFHNTVTITVLDLPVHWFARIVRMNERDGWFKKFSAKASVYA